MQRTLQISLTALLLGVLAAAIYLWAPLKENQSLSDAQATAHAYDVEIIRDSWGVPHIFGERDADVAFGLAYVQSEDDLETLQSVIAATRGKLARYQGADAAVSDYLVNLLNVWPLVDRDYSTRLSKAAQDMAEAYAAGVNLYVAENPQKAMKGLYPITGKDVVAGFVFKTPFFYGAQKVLTQLLTGTEERALAIAPTTPNTAFHFLPRNNVDLGSNAIAVAPERSGDKSTRLFVNSHQPYTGPVAWYEAHLISEEGLDVYGGTFPGGPVIFHGFNRNLGWANTVNNPDLIDVYQLKLNPENEDEYLLDGQYQPFEISNATIPVGLWGPFAYPAREKVYRSVHGPVFKTDRGAFAIRYAGMNEVRQMDQYLALNKAANFEEWQQAMSMVALPSINYIYADQAGNIAFIHNGQFPLREPGWDWSRDLPGDRSDLVWQNYRPYEDIPKLINPQSGFVFNANNSPFLATDGNDNLRKENFDMTYGLQQDHTNRSLRLMELARQNKRISRDKLIEIKFDKHYSQQSTAAQVVEKILAIDFDHDPALQAAQQHLGDWDLNTNAENRHAALGVLSTMLQVTSTLTGKKAPTATQTFTKAVSELEKYYGRIDPLWGEVNRIVRGELSLPIGGASDVLRAVYPSGEPSEGKLKAAAGDTLILLAEWDEDGLLTGSTIHQFGSATLDSSSRHYSDQVALFANEQFRPVLMDRDKIEADASRTYSPGK